MKKNFPSTVVSAVMLSLVWLMLPSAGDLQAADMFTKITSGLIVTRAGSGRGCSWGDYNNDGFIDLYVANSAADGRGTTGGADFLFQNNRDGTFTDVRAAALITDPVDSQGCVWGDYDNDGHLDLFVSAYFGGNNKNSLYRNQGDGTFAKVGADKLVSEGGNSTASAWGDFNNDGFIDVVVANSLFSSSPSLDLFYQNLGQSGFRKLTNNIVSEPRYGRGVSWADYDNDGRLDLFVANAALSGTQRTNRLYRNLGEGVFQPVTGPGPGGESGVSFSGSWADYDNDGDLDLFVANGGWEQVRTSFLYRNNGDGTFTKITNGDIVTDQFGSVYGTWGDYDNDGFLDLFVSHSSPANTSPSYQPTVKNSLYHNNGDGTFTKVTSGSLVNDLGCSLGSAWGDYDNDGFLDLYVTNFGSRVNDLYHNNGNTNSWIIINCIGTFSNRSAIGAKVRLRATIRGQTTWQMREISGGGGYTSQNDLRAHFGLGDATSADLIRIEWPSGVVQELRDVAARQVLAVQESNADIFPAQADVSLGGALTLSVTHVPPDSALQWRLNGVDIAGATNATLEFTNATTNLNGRYTVVVSNATGSVFPRPAVVRVFDRPIITSQPWSTNAIVGSNVTLSVSAISPSLPITYQWQFNSTNIAGATNASHAITNAQLDSHAGYYRVLVSDTVSNVWSATATLVVLVRPTITSQPLAQTVLQGGTATFSVVGTPNHPLLPLTYRWVRNGTTFLSSGPPTLVITNCQANANFRCQLINAAGNINSAQVPLTVLPDSDRDGMADDWEMRYGFDTNTVADATVDSDGDGLSNGDEYLAGTNPTNAVSTLKLQIAASAQGQSAVTFLAVSNRTYTVEWTPQLTGGTWTKLLDVLAQPAERTESVTDTNTIGPARFYRVVTPRRP